MNKSPLRTAASLVLLRGDKNNPQILLGRRKASLRFMPGYYVFPGGCIDDTDYEEIANMNINAINPISGVMANLTKAETATYIFGAIRELWEETGLLLGQPSKTPLAGFSNMMKAFNANQLSPQIYNCQCIAQAITPAKLPIRFNTYFFSADGTNATTDSPPCGELEDIGWHDYEDVFEYLHIADVTRSVLKEAKNHWNCIDTPVNTGLRVPLMTYPLDKLEIQR